jgi:hypothetical protein
MLCTLGRKDWPHVGSRFPSGSQVSGLRLFRTGRSVSLSNIVDAILGCQRRRCERINTPLWNSWSFCALETEPVAQSGLSISMPSL